MATTELILQTAVKGTEQATKALNDVKGSLDKIKKSAGTMKTALEEIGKVSAIAFATFSAIVYKGKLAIEEDAEATNRLTKLLKVASKATDEQVISLIAQAEALEKSTVAGYDMIVTTQSQLATFNLQASTIQKLTPAILDYVIAEKGASASADEYRSMTQGLAQALNGNFTSLTKSGFILDQHTKNLIKNGTEAQKADAIYKVLQSTYKGFATDATQTAIGSQIQLNKSLEDVSKIVATSIIPILNDLKIKTLGVAQEVLKWAEANPELTKQIILVTGAVTAMGASILIIAPILTSTWTILAGGIALLKTLATVLTFLATNPIVLIGGAIAGLGIILYKLVTDTKNTIETMKSVWNTFSSYFITFMNSLQGIIEKIGTALVEIGKKIIDGIGTYFTTFMNSLQVIIEKGLTSAKEWGGNMIQMFVDGLKEKVQALKDGITSIATTIEDYLGFHSPTKKGPGKDADKWMPNLITMLAQGLSTGTAVIDMRAKEIATKLSAIGKKFSISEISSTLSSLSGKASEAFAKVTASIEASASKIKGLKSDISDITNKINELTGNKKTVETEGRAKIGERAVEIEKELALLKQQTASEMTAEDLVKMNALQNELTFAKSIITAEEYQLAVMQSQKSETQKILDNIALRKLEIDTEIQKNKQLLLEKQNDLKAEEQAYKELARTRVNLENQYYDLFKSNINGVQQSIQRTIDLMMQLNRLRGGSVTSSSLLSGARASGGPVAGGSSYLVGEKGPEIFTPGTSGQIIPNHKIGGSSGGIVINISGMFGSDAAEEIGNMIVTKLTRASYV